jgi:hypothetical protein
LNYQRNSKLGIRGESKININDIEDDTNQSENSVSEDNYCKDKFEEIEKGDGEVEITEPEVNLYSD